ncbi:MAG TPA: PD-(D/E)XK nuclease family protein [Patescibacteria group bacterium]|nr:PD-(D/E)XK nuclease family protein [Patescibacteria group bacterium]
MYKISPSDFAYLYEECKLCYCLKVKFGIYQPSMPMPGVFSAINTRLQGNLIGKNLKTLSEELPDGEVVTQEGWVESKVIPGTDLYLKGKYDLLVRKKDGTYILVDLKISQPGEDKIGKYKTQLGAYKFALENPASGKPVKITSMGLLVFYPTKAAFKDGEAILFFPPKWLEVPVDEKGFLQFTKEIDLLLEGALPPEGKDCKWCKYRHVGDEIAHKPVQEDIPF